MSRINLPAGSSNNQEVTLNGQKYRYNSAKNKFVAIPTSGGGSSTFVGLSDTPADFTSAEGKTVTVNSEGTSLEFTATGTSITSVSPAQYDGDSGTAFTIIGTNFDVGTVVDFITASGAVHRASTTSIVTQGEITALTPQAFTTADGPLDVKVTLSNGESATSTDVIQTGSNPVWTTASGTLYQNAYPADVTAGDNSYRLGMALDETIVATDPDSQTITYSIESGALPTNGSLDTASGNISGTLPTTLSGDTTYSFTAGATDTSGNLTTRAFNIIVKNASTTKFTRQAARKWVYADNVRHVSDLLDDIDSTFSDGIIADNTGSDDAQKLAWGAYVKFNMLVQNTSTTKTCIAFINRNSTNNEWALSALDFGDHPLRANVYDKTKQLRWVNTTWATRDSITWGNGSAGYESWNTGGRISRNLANDDNDGSFLRADGSLILTEVNTYNRNSVTNGYTYYLGNADLQNGSFPGAPQLAHTGPAIFASTSTTPNFTYNPSRQTGNYGSTASFLGVRGEVHFDFSNATYTVSVLSPNNSTLTQFSSQNLNTLTGYSTLSGTTLQNTSNAAGTSRVIITDGFGQGIIGRNGHQGLYFEVDWTTGILVNTSLKTTTFDRLASTEEDIWGDVLHTVIGQKMIVGNGYIYHTSGLNGSNTSISSAHANWKSDYGANTSNLGSHQYFTTKSSGNSQHGMDLWAYIDSGNNVYFGDWGHDDGGVFGQGNDNYFTMQRTNIRRIPSNWY